MSAYFQYPSSLHSYLGREQILKNQIRPTTVLCTPALIKAITPRLGRHLGPLGLMPSERRGTVLDDMAGYLQRLRGTSEWRADKSGTIRMPIGVVSILIQRQLIPLLILYTSVEFPRRRRGSKHSVYDDFSKEGYWKHA